MEIRTFSILAIIITSLALAIMPAYAENLIAIPAGSSVLGCEEKNECYIPYETKIANGSKITWSNDDHVAHTITSGTIKEGPDGIFDSGLFVSGKAFSHVFEKEGTFDYFCTIHPWMNGIIIVKESESVIEEVKRETERKTTTENEIKLADAKEETYENKTKTTEIEITEFMMNVDENKIVLDYDITEEAHVWDIYPDTETNSLVIKLNATEKGSLAITLPRHVIDATFDDKEDDEFFVLVNEEEVDFDEIVTATNRTLTIEFPDNTDEIEIIGSFVIPEFRAIAVMVLAIAIASIIVISAKSRLGTIPRL